MIGRTDAVNARDGMESYKSGDMQLRVSELKSRYNRHDAYVVSRLDGV